MSIYVFYTLYVYCFTCVCVVYIDKRYLFHTQNLKHQYATLHQLTHASELKTESGGHLWIFPQPVWVFHRSHDLMDRFYRTLHFVFVLQIQYTQFFRLLNKPRSEINYILHSTYEPLSPGESCYMTLVDKNKNQLWMVFKNLVSDAGGVKPLLFTHLCIKIYLFYWTNCLFKIKSKNLSLKWLWYWW